MKIQVIFDISQNLHIIFKYILKYQLVVQFYILNSIKFNFR